MNESSLREEYDISYFVGIDECGWGAIAGPVTVCCAVLPVESTLEIRDSKKYHKEAKREEAYKAALDHVLFHRVIHISPREIERLGAGKALQAAFYQAATEATELFSCSLVCVDGKHPVRGLKHPQVAVIGGDDKIRAVAAASVIGKVQRDRLMTEYHKEYPPFQFGVNKGYPTKQHLDVMNKAGVTMLHRRSISRVQKVFDTRGWCLPS